MRFKNAIVRTPCFNMIHGLTEAGLGKPDYDLALIQHAQYIAALKQCGLDVLVMEADEMYPDSTFVEDTALLTPACAIITRPGAQSRRGETASIANVLKNYYRTIETIQPPGTVDAGDIMMVGNHFYIGLSGRTDPSGAQQLIRLLQRHHLTASTVTVPQALHLKAGAAYLENNHVVLTEEFGNLPEFSRYTQIRVKPEEGYAANCVWINGTVLVASGFPETLNAIKAAGYKTISLDMSEFQKLDGGLSCLSLWF
jgi:dimethylargininase